MYTIKNEDVVSCDLLSVEEAKNLPRWIRSNVYWWWLRSPGNCFYYAAFVYCDGFLDNSDGVDVDNDDGAVRPVLQVSNLDSLNLEIGETVKVFNLMAEYIGENKVLLCEPIFKSCFDSESNDYETSEVKKKIDEWFKEVKE